MCSRSKRPILCLYKHSSLCLVKNISRENREDGVSKGECVAKSCFEILLLIQSQAELCYQYQKKLCSVGGELQSLIHVKSDYMSHIFSTILKCSAQFCSDMLKCIMCWTVSTNVSLDIRPQVCPART